jgi:hypothetical protein
VPVSCRSPPFPLSYFQAGNLGSLSTLLQEAIDLARRRETLTPAGYARRVREIENRLDDWLDRLPRSLSRNWIASTTTSGLIAVSGGRLQ